ncbi:GNAT family acetyltransferase [Gregarina niphandrodes]|uniref:N-alpha-acetyltransferase 40 n=1 Tax=Gregarina niphandrodes TaxID=110365 RepID=A0A023B5J9_GRENI|nr:GNAT family acetyltransferase [Gregarina niphandrodes]EZG61139.1 GNAT family acetyltransferase [Gregarina niphandrodes]|eukprot:XP_011130792.1 GNAT family acetyltransferase [Gregarina niphandrodes]
MDIVSSVTVEWSIFRLNMSELYERNQWKNMYSDKMGYCTNSKLKELQQPGILYFVRNNEPAGQEDVAGFLKLDLADDAFVMELQVQPCAQSRGIGSQLLKSAFNDVQAAGYKALNLCVQRGNDRALNFYTNKMGFKITDEFPSYYLLSHDIN